LSFFRRISLLVKNKVWQKLFENFLSLTVLQGLSFAIELLTLPYLTRTLGVYNFGIISFALSFIMFLQIVTEYGFSHSGTRVISKYRDDHDKLQKIYSSINYVKIIISSGCLISLIIIINIFEKFKQNSVIFLLLFGVIIQSIFFPIWYFRGIEKMRYIAIFDFISKIFLLASIFLFVKSESDYVIYALLVFVRAILISVITQIFLVKKYDMRLKKTSFKDIKLQFSFGFFLFLVYLSTNVINNLNPFILGLLEDYYYVGIFSAGYKVIQMFVLIISLITTTVFPHIVKLVKDNDNKMETKTTQFIRKVLLLILVIGILSLIFLFVFADLIVKIFFGPTYVEAVNVIKLLSFAPLLIGIGHTLTLQVLVPLQYDSQVAIIYGSSAILDIVASFIFIPLFGYIGLCIIIIISRFLIIVLSLILIRRKDIKLNLLNLKNSNLSLS
jgi:PST family polysaccharide transporter